MYLVVLRAYLSYFVLRWQKHKSGHSLPVSTKHFCREICWPLGIFYISFVSLTCNKKVGFFGILCMYLKRTRKIKGIHAKMKYYFIRSKCCSEKICAFGVLPVLFFGQFLSSKFFIFYLFGKLEFKEELNWRRCRAKAQVRHVICPCLHFYVSSTNFTCFVFIDSSSFLSFPSWPAIFPPVYS